MKFADEPCAATAVAALTFADQDAGGMVGCLHERGKWSRAVQSGHSHNINGTTLIAPRKLHGAHCTPGCTTLTA
eukprot:8107502-Pyramimonas_sp.AAC.1